ncbi:MAG: oligopeptide/dipeptide ABC transporter ATP-binding protein [Desulfobacteraceae bacterium]|nr:oligopeptide/dipeptide ABC transporter ATP-binding protein [Desulfobacteraceae bacterium]
MKRPSQPVIEMDRITKIYRSKQTLFGKKSSDRIVALNGVSFQINRGEIFGLVGESGSGKTTAGRLMVKLEKPDQGRVLLDGQDMTRIRGKMLKAFRSNVQMIFQDPYQSLNPQLSIYDTVAEPLIVHGRGDHNIRSEKISQALSAVRLTPALDYFARYPHELSGGQRQRVAISRAMVLNPEFIVADEPTSMLDATTSYQIFGILSTLREKYGVTFLFITHSLAAAKFLCDRIAVIYRGNLVEMGPAQKIIRRPSHPYTMALLDALPAYCRDSACTFYNTLLKTEREAPPHDHCPFFARCGRADQNRCPNERPAMVPLSDTHSVACFKAG